jgi:PAS domain
MKREASVNLLQYWNDLREGRRAPRRTEIEPSNIKTLLGDTFILETAGRGEAVFRLACSPAPPDKHVTKVVRQWNSFKFEAIFTLSLRQDMLYLA